MMICIIVAITTKRIAEQLEGTCEQQSARGSHRAAAFLFVLNEKEYFELSFVITLFGTTRRVFSFSSMIFDSEPAGQAHTMKIFFYLNSILIYIQVQIRYAEIVLAQQPQLLMNQLQGSIKKKVVQKTAFFFCQFPFI